MSEAGYQVTHIDQIPEPAGEEGAGEPDWHAVRIHFGIQSFGVNAYTADAGGRDRRRARRSRHAARGALLRLEGKRDVHDRRRSGRRARGNLRLPARSGVDPVGRRPRGRHDDPLLRRRPPARRSRSRPGSRSTTRPRLGELERDLPAQRRRRRAGRPLADGHVPRRRRPAAEQDRRGRAHARDDRRSPARAAANRARRGGAVR